MYFEATLQVLVGLGKRLTLKNACLLKIIQSSSSWLLLCLNKNGCIVNNCSLPAQTPFTLSAAGASAICNSARTHRFWFQPLMEEQSNGPS